MVGGLQVDLVEQIASSQSDQAWFDPDRVLQTYSTGPRDDRLVVKNTDVRPLNSICRLTEPSGLVATATAIGGRFLLTAAHNLISTGGASIWTAAPAYNRKHLYGPIAVNQEIAHPRWRADADPRFDVGLLVLASDAPHAISLSSWSDGDGDDRIYVSGYGASRPEVQKFHSGAFGAVAGNLVAHTCDTEGGQSGAPVLAYGTGRTRLIAVHAYGYQDLSAELPGPFNKAVRITPEIHAWVREQMAREDK